MKNNTFTPLASSLPKGGAQERQVAESKKAPKDGEAVRHTLYLPEGVYDLLLETAVSRRTKIQRICREALDDWFAKEGLPSWDEAKRRGER